MAYEFLRCPLVVISLHKEPERLGSIENEDPESESSDRRPKTSKTEIKVNSNVIFEELVLSRDLR